MTTATIYQMGLPVLVVAYHSATTSTQLTPYQLRVYSPSANSGGRGNVWKYQYDPQSPWQAMALSVGLL